MTSKFGCLVFRCSGSAWLRRRCEVRQLALLSRNRANRLHLLQIIAAQEEHSSDFYYYLLHCTSAVYPPIGSVWVKPRSHNRIESSPQQPARMIFCCRSTVFLVRHLNSLNNLVKPESTLPLSRVDPICIIQVQPGFTPLSLIHVKEVLVATRTYKRIV